MYKAVPGLTSELSAADFNPPHRVFAMNQGLGVPQSKEGRGSWGGGDGGWTQNVTESGGPELTLCGL